ncbi:hypothetical protein FQA39_LY01159 [Lamprigera yunnana]|nr:hypothetical protein FQA39_LY01159 [Lamprigera yunnana]
MHNINTTECNGPTQTSDESEKWKCKDAKNGYLKTENKEENVGALLGPAPVTTVVQVSGSGARTMVLPGKRKPSREKFLVAALLALVLFSLICLLLFINGNYKECATINGVNQATVHVVTTLRSINLEYFLWRAIGNVNCNYCGTASNLSGIHER